jgi:hypothetical protein
MHSRFRKNGVSRVSRALWRNDQATGKETSDGIICTVVRADPGRESPRRSFYCQGKCESEVQITPPFWRLPPIAEEVPAKALSTFLDA